MKVIPDDIALKFFYHPSAKRISESIKPGIWNEKEMRFDNVCRILKYVMITGQTDELMKKLNEPHTINVNGEQIYIDEMVYPIREDLQYIEDHNLMKDALYYYGINNRLRRTLIYCDEKNQVRHAMLDSDDNRCSCNEVIVYKKLYGIIQVSGPEYVKYITERQQMIDTLKYHTIKVTLVNNETI